MSCQACEEAQVPQDNGLTGLTQATYIRASNANVLIAGCKKHLGELIYYYREGLKTGAPTATVEPMLPATPPEDR